MARGINGSDLPRCGAAGPAAADLAGSVATGMAGDGVAMAEEAAGAGSAARTLRLVPDD